MSIDEKHIGMVKNYRPLCTQSLEIMNLSIAALLAGEGGSRG